MSREDLGALIDALQEHLVLAEVREKRLVKTLKAAFIEKDDDVFYRTAKGIPMDVPERIARPVRALLDEIGAGP